MWVIAVRHAESLPLEQCAGFLQSLRQDLEELSPLLWQPQSPQDRQCLFDVIEQSRLVLETLDYDVLPRYSPDPEYEDDPPELMTTPLGGTAKRDYRKMQYEKRLRELVDFWRLYIVYFALADVKKALEHSEALSTIDLLH